MSEPFDISLQDCLREINHALNYWYPLKGQADEEERTARHVRLFQFRDRLERQLRPQSNQNAENEHRKLKG